MSKFLGLVVTLLLCTRVYAQEVWAPSSIPVVAPYDYGDTSNCSANGLPALNAAIAALPAAGGVVRLAGPNGSPWCTRKDDLLVVAKPNVLLWGENRAGQIFERQAGLQDKSAIAFTAGGGGVYGVLITGDGARRWTTPNSNSVVFWMTSNNEVVGSDISGASVGVFMYGGGTSFIEGNRIHHTWADHIHHTGANRNSWVWGNLIFNEAPSNGDDGVACVTYGPGTARCGAMEWWGNVILHTGSGRGLACVGGDTISIHDNWVYGSSSAGIILASEGNKNTEACIDTSVVRNHIYGAAWQVTSHTGILVSGGNSGAAPVSGITLADNVSYGASAGPYRTEGLTANITNTGLVSAEPPEGTPAPPVLPATDTATLRTRNTTFAPASMREGLYRIHLRPMSAGAGFQVRYEYVVKGEPGRLMAWVAQQVGAGAYLSEQRTVSGVAYALVLSPRPTTVSTGLSGATFPDMRTPALAWLWARVDAGTY